jgi:serine/threonine protein kinase
MELVRGPSLAEVLFGLDYTDRLMTESQAIDVALPVLGSLAEAHRHGLVHRDLKPGNIMLTGTPEEPLIVKVLDFGLVREGRASITTSGTALGTPTYMSPEQCVGDPVDARSDLYSLAVILYECVTGSPPYDERNPVDLMCAHINSPVPDPGRESPALSPDFCACLQAALAKEPDDRPATAEAMSAMLHGIREAEWPDLPLTPLSDLLPPAPVRVPLDGRAYLPSTEPEMQRGGVALPERPEQRTAVDLPVDFRPSRQAETSAAGQAEAGPGGSPTTRGGGSAPGARREPGGLGPRAWRDDTDVHSAVADAYAASAPPPPARSQPSTRVEAPPAPQAAPPSAPEEHRVRRPQRLSPAQINRAIRLHDEVRMRRAQVAPGELNGPTPARTLKMGGSAPADLPEAAPEVRQEYPAARRAPAPPDPTDPGNRRVHLGPSRRLGTATLLGTGVPSSRLPDSDSDEEKDEGQ